MFNFDKQVSHIGGWLTKNEANFLYKIAKSISSKGKIVEIGSWKGRSTICLGMGSKDGRGATVYAIDPHTGSSEHKKQFGRVDTYKDFLLSIKKANVTKFVNPIKTTSEIADTKITGCVDFVFVDGAHEYYYVNKDYLLWFPRLINNGLIIFHDCWHAPGVQWLTAKILFTSDKIRKPKLIDTMTIMEKVERNTVFNRFYNRSFVFYRLLFGWIGTIKMNLWGKQS